MTFSERLQQRITETGSSLCVGLDPRPERTRGDLKEFLFRFIEETEAHAAAYKPNIAYFEALGSEGVAILESVLERLAGRAPVILDCKRSDIGETQKYYAKAYFERWNVDAVTLSPFLGYDSVEPFLEYEGKGVYLLAVTSNAGSADFQQQKLEDGRLVFQLVQELLQRGRSEGLPGTGGLVVGLTNVSGPVLEKIDDVPLLVPGLGAQGGDLGGLAGQGREAPILINVSRGLMYGEGNSSFGEKAREYADQIAGIL